MGARFWSRTDPSVEVACCRSAANWTLSPFEIDEEALGEETGLPLASCFETRIVSAELTLDCSRGCWEASWLVAVCVARVVDERETDPVDGDKCTEDVGVTGEMFPLIGAATAESTAIELALKVACSEENVFTPEGDADA